MSVSNAGGSVVFFGLRLNFFRDKKILLLEERLGEKACYRLLKLWAYIYSQGNYIDWDEDDCRLYCKTDGVDREFTEQLIEECLKLNLFNIPLYEKYNILTSRFIQEEYMAATANKNQITIVWDYLILDHELKCKDTTRRKVFFINRSGKEIKREDLKKYTRINTDYEKPMPSSNRPEQSTKPSSPDRQKVFEEAINGFFEKQAPAPVEEDRCDNTVVYSFEEAWFFSKRVYSEEDELFKGQVKSQAWLDSYNKILTWIDNEFKNLKIMEIQMSFSEYKEIYDKYKFKEQEIYAALKKLSLSGNFNKYSPLKDKTAQYLYFIKHPDGKNGASIEPKKSSIPLITGSPREAEFKKIRDQQKPNIT